MANLTITLDDRGSGRKSLPTYGWLGHGLNIVAAGNCRSCGGDGGWYEEEDRGKRWVTCSLCNGSGEV
jgi:hypothetical protein